VKKILIGCGGVLAVLVVVAAGAFFWWEKTGGPERLKAWGTNLQAEGKALGTSKGDVACVDESVARLRACGGSICRGSVLLFTMPCLGSSEQTKELCDPFPERQTFEKTDWAKRYCATKGYSQETCAFLLPSLWSHCRASLYRVAASTAAK
jgi:hypothetical protein